jgi:hypothetical protein
MILPASMSTSLSAGLNVPTAIFTPSQTFAALRHHIVSPGIASLNFVSMSDILTLSKQRLRFTGTISPDLWIRFMSVGARRLLSILSLYRDFPVS